VTASRSGTRCLIQIQNGDCQHLAAFSTFPRGTNFATVGSRLPNDEKIEIGVSSVTVGSRPKAFREFLPVPA
jgi:hypothetical protein